MSTFTPAKSLNAPCICCFKLLIDFFESLEDELLSRSESLSSLILVPFPLLLAHIGTVTLLLFDSHEYFP